MRNTHDTMAWLREQHTNGSTSWFRLCLGLQTAARGIPPLYPSALAAAEATPASERVHDVAQLRRGMVLFFDNPHDDNPFGHIVGAAGWKDDGRTLDSMMTWTNDASVRGGVSLVPASFFVNVWGAPFQFGATWLNGYSFPDFDQPPKPAPGRESIGGNLDKAIADVRKAMNYQRSQHHTGRVNALAKDLAELKQTRAQYPR